MGVGMVLRYGGGNGDGVEVWGREWGMVLRYGGWC